ncbi:MAG: DUF1990 family protein [Actinobacteria bacterium]|nr:DUF1990 family protein [Rubrobacter sp.]MBA3630880.1 DUF1990 family protein [Actinomycetota bacterium]
MSRTGSSTRTLTALVRWPFGVGLTSWRYMWRTTPMRRLEMEEQAGRSEPPPLPEQVELGDALLPEQGFGPLFHRLYRVAIEEANLRAAELMGRIQVDPNAVSPKEFARFHKVDGASGRMHLGDDYLIHMPGPWNGPVRVVDLTTHSFRFMTLKGHLEAGQIEFRATDDVGLIFEIESWARSGDRLSHVLYDNLRMAKEIQLHMWTSTLERVVKVSGGVRHDLIRVETHRTVVDGRP